ncbi:MAG: hypothetical protein VKP62_09695 [Candidatus Sericytochromatia bacterium]|nr:hypothetical protein [Candidatus Sericytochromatia bacterium]
MTDFTASSGVNHGTISKFRLFQQSTQSNRTTSPSIAGDQLSIASPIGGTGVDPRLLQQTDQMMQSPNVSDRYRAIVSLTKMPPQDAIPRLQAMVAAPGQDPQVIQLANEAMRVMGQMAQQPVSPQAAPGYAQQAFPQAAVMPPQQAMPAPTYNPGIAPPNPADAPFLMERAQAELGNGGQASVNAIRQLMALSQSNPQYKEPVYNLLLNHAYHQRDASVKEALVALASFQNPQLLPYLEMIQRSPGYPLEVNQTAVNLIVQMNNQRNQAGVAAAGPAVTPDYLRSLEFELNRDTRSGVAALNQIRAALGPDPRANSPLRQEVVRILVTHIATQTSSETIVGACQLLGQMGAREMDTLRHLLAVSQNPGRTIQAQESAKAAIQQILASPPRP